MNALNWYAGWSLILASFATGAIVGLFFHAALPDEAAAHADYVVVGEGENAWPFVVRAAECNDPPQIIRAGLFPAVNTASLPVPRYDLLGGRPYNRFTVQTTRGCPWRCEFCASNVMLEQPYRKRPVAEILRDIEAIRRVRGHPFIEFADDNTFVDKAWGKQLCRALAPLRLKWFTETDVSVAEDPELLELMHEAGCRQVLIGLESPQRDPLTGLEIRHNFKARSFERYVEACRRIQAHGITVNGCFILGLDGHTSAVFAGVLEFARAVPLYDVQITVLTAFPGTPLYRRLERENRILAPNRWDLCTLFDVNYEPRGMSVADLQQGMRWLTTQLYREECTAQRRAEFFRNWRATSVSAVAEGVA